MNLSQPALERSDVPAGHFRGAFERKACAPMREDQVHLARLAERRGERFLSRPAQRAHLALRVPSSQSNSALLLAFLTEEEFAVPLDHTRTWPPVGEKSGAGGPIRVSQGCDRFTPDVKLTWGQHA